MLMEPGIFRTVKDVRHGEVEWPVWNVHAAGICRTDVLLTRYPSHTPVVLGHEVVCRDAQGHFYALNNEVVCGACSYCCEGKTSHCCHLRELGVNEHGGFAETVRAPRENLIPFDGTDPRIGILIEPLACAMHAVDRLVIVLGLHSVSVPRVLIQGSGVSGKLIAYVLRALHPKLSIYLFDTKPDAMAWASAFPEIQLLAAIPA